MATAMVAYNICMLFRWKRRW